MTVVRPVHFVADVHLICGEPNTWAAFFAYLRGPARTASAVYLLGDIFDAWIGDDDERELAQLAIQELTSLVQAGVATSLLFGNHDFMIGKRFSRMTGVQLLGERAVIEVGGKRTLLLHGDTLITGDVSYQRARQKMIAPWHLFYARLLPRKVRRAKASHLLGGDSEHGFSVKDMEVDEEMVVQELAASAAQVLIHGHTHAPAKHQLSNDCERWVLPLWTGTQGGWLEVSAQEWNLRDYQLAAPAAQN